LTGRLSNERFVFVVGTTSTAAAVLAGCPFLAGGVSDRIVDVDLAFAVTGLALLATSTGRASGHTASPLHDLAILPTLDPSIHPFASTFANAIALREPVHDERPGQTGGDGNQDCLQPLRHGGSSPATDGAAHADGCAEYDCENATTHGSYSKCFPPFGTIVGLVYLR